MFIWIIVNDFILQYGYFDNTNGQALDTYYQLFWVLRSLDRKNIVKFYVNWAMIMLASDFLTFYTLLFGLEFNIKIIKKNSETKKKK